MATAIEEQQARDFLKRAEIRTMKKDLSALRESDALKERDKIAKIKTLEEQIEEAKKSSKSAALPPAPRKINSGETQNTDDLKKVLRASIHEEKLAEKDLKKYATEQERQQIFLLESQRLSLESQTDAIDKEKIPNLKLEKNKFDIKKIEIQAKIKPTSDQEKKLENEQAVVIKEARDSAIPAQKKSLEQRRWELDREIKEAEKKRWALEKQIQDTDEKVKEIDSFLSQLVSEKNNLNSKILGADKSLREIYSGIISRVEQQRSGEDREQKEKKEVLQKKKLEENENIRREQWTGIAVPKKKEFLKSAPQSFKEKLAKSAEGEEEQRSQFFRDVEKNYNANDAN